MPKIATIKNFAGMEENGLYYLENFMPRKVGGKSVLMPRYYTNQRLDENDTGFSGLTDGISAMCKFNYEDNEDKVFVVGGSNLKFFEMDALFFPNIGEIHDAPIDTTPNPDLTACDFPDCLSTQENNVIWSGGYALGYVIIGTAKSSSTQTKIVDKDGRNLSTFGMGTSAWNNKAYNLTTKEQYTITSISTTYSTKDTINFSTASKTINTGDYIAYFADIGAYNGGSSWDFFATTAYPHFKGQDQPGYWVRQIKQFDTDYLIGNGNYIAALNIDETTWNDNFKQLPASTQFMCMDVNQDRILVGGEINGRGRIMLWDGFSDGWLSIIEVPIIPKLIMSYQNGWVVFVGSTLYFTNGYTLQKLTKIPDTEGFSTQSALAFNSGAVYGDELFFGLGGQQIYNRAKRSVAVYNPNLGWSLCPVNFKNQGAANMTESNRVRLFQVDYSGNPYLFYYGQTETGTNNAVIGTVNEGASGGATATFKLDFDEEVNITKVVLKMAKVANIADTSSNAERDVNVSMGRNDLPFFKYTQALTGSTTTTIKVSGQYEFYQGKVGNLIRMMEGDCGGEFSYIQSIADAGTSDETWTISPALSATPDPNSDVQQYNLRDCGTRQLNTLRENPDFLDFYPVDMKSDSFFLQVHLEAGRFQIERIDIYGN